MTAAIAHLRPRCVSALLLIGALAACETGPRLKDASALTPFKAIPADFTHVWVEPSHPFTGAAAIDVDGDGRDEVFVGGGRDQSDGLLAFENGRLVNRIDGSGLGGKTGATHGVASTDMDLDGDVDLVVARDTGVTLYLNDGGGRFVGQPIPVSLPEDGTPLSVSAADVDADGDVDLYLSVFVSFPAFVSASFNDPDHAKRNILLLNQGGLRFADGTAAAGVSGLQNTFHSTFVNLDGDDDLDLVLAQNTGEIEIFDNTGGGRFTPRPTQSGYGFWMGLGVGDIEQDGDQDLLVSNVGSSIPDFLTTGDLRDDQRHNADWALLRNDGDFAFTDVIADEALNGYGFAWGAVFEDLDQDGEIDLLVAQNYLKWPFHSWFPNPGKTLVQRIVDGRRGFYDAPELGLANPHYGQSPLIADLNGDGRPDVMWLNMDGPLLAFLNRGDGPFLTLDLNDDIRTQGAEIAATLDDGRILRRQVVSAQGLMTDDGATIFLGAPDGRRVTKVEVTRLHGEVSVIEAPTMNQSLPIRQLR